MTATPGIFLAVPMGGPCFSAAVLYTVARMRSQLPFAGSAVRSPTVDSSDSTRGTSRAANQPNEVEPTDSGNITNNKEREEQFQDTSNKIPPQLIV